MLLLDTHVWVWSLLQPDLIPAPLRGRIAAASPVLVPPCALYEMAQQHRLGKWPEVGALIPRLPSLLRAQGGQAAPFTPEMALLAGAMDWPHRDPFDRMIAATAIELSCPIVSKDPAFDALAGTPGWKGRVWG